MLSGHRVNVVSNVRRYRTAGEGVIVTRETKGENASQRDLLVARRGLRFFSSEYRRALQKR